MHGGGIGDAYRILMIIAARDVRRAQNTALRVFVLFWLGRVTCCIFGLRSAILERLEPKEDAPATAQLKKY